mmetsp:Transcript_44419/g.110521  ORF Transcript_44419/g.110521 Transcript_44419/m.110521 type:complete len:484 (+) Transcript_44419:48-1499(+)
MPGEEVASSPYKERAEEGASAEAYGQQNRREEGDEDFDEDDPRWLYSRPLTELQEYCDELGIDRDGTEEELADRLLEELEARANDEEEGEGGEEEYEDEEEEVEEPRKYEDPASPHPESSQAAAHDPTSGTEGEATTRMASRMRELGSVRNDKFRRGLDWSARISAAEQLKEDANEAFKRADNTRAVGAYLAAIWLLKPENPPSPNALASAIWAVRPDDPLCPPDVVDTSEQLKGFEGARLLGEGSAEPRRADMRIHKLNEAGPSEEDRIGLVEWLRWACRSKDVRALGPVAGASLGRRAVDLRLSIHLNVAMAAIKREDYELAEQACLFVLRRQPDHPKALYRVALAQKGAGQPRAALKTLARLLRLPGQNANTNARQLVAAVREQIKEDADSKQARLHEQQTKLRNHMTKLEEQDYEKKQAEDEARKNYVPPKQVRDGPRVGSTISVYWSGDQQWTEGVVISKVWTDGKPMYKVWSPEWDA